MYINKHRTLGNRQAQTLCVPRTQHINTVHKLLKKEDSRTGKKRTDTALKMNFPSGCL